MNKVFVAVTAMVALGCATSPALAKKKEKVSAVPVEAPYEPIKPVLASFPVGVSSAVPSISANGALLPTNTEIVVRMNSELNSKQAKEGSAFTMTVAYDVMLGNMVVIPRGAPASGVVTWRTGKGAFGKSAKMTYEIRSLDLGGQRVPLSGKFRQEGRGNTGAAVGAVVAVGVFGAFVTGKSAIVEQGRELKVYTTAAIPVVLPQGAPAAVSAPVEAPVSPVPIAPATPVPATTPTSTQ
ncbi:hypothetical protein [Sphingomonas sp. ERG5]|uniref:hypothetical protein n=1 Tax=Sphingomonas sp. ERG5 TaxID=1381597 RepID=UPI00068D8831|nr:hypothetical protein [Sphingomonas sp. ERG5]